MKVDTQAREKARAAARKLYPGVVVAEDAEVQFAALDGTAFVAASVCVPPPEDTVENEGKR